MVVSDSPKFNLRWMLLPETDPSWLQNERWIPEGESTIYNYARTGIYTALNELNHRQSSREPPKALLPAFIPHGVVWAFLEARYEVIFYPVGHDLSLPLDAIESLIKDHEPSVILIVHYFGFADQAFQPLVNIARENRITIIENCARGLFGRDQHGTLLGTMGDVAIFSLYKVLPIPNGGLAVSKSIDMEKPRRPTPERTDLLRISAKTLLEMREKPTKVPDYLTKFRNSNQSHQPPAKVWPEFGIGGVSRRGIGRIDPEKIAMTRRSRYRRMRIKLLNSDILTVVTPSAPPKSAPYGVAVTVHGGTDRRRNLYSRIRAAGLPVEIFSWPLKHGADTASQYPGAVALRSALMVFPTHQRMTTIDIDRIVSIIDDFPRVN